MKEQEYPFSETFQRVNKYNISITGELQLMEGEIVLMKLKKIKSMQILKYFMILVLTGQILVSCKNESDGTDSGNRTDAGNAVRECYLYVSDYDTIKMNITIHENKVSGSLEYKYYEKDKNTGTINGELRENKLSAIYSFMSEGVKSTRQVIFQKKGETFTEGYYVDGNYTIVDFPGTVVLQKVQCE